MPAITSASGSTTTRRGWASGRLRVWNDDEIAAADRLRPAPHRDMEIITYVRQGAITHQDSLGNEGRTEAGDVQVMSAGTGIRHAEYNREDERDPDLPDLDQPANRVASSRAGARRLSQGRAGGRARAPRLGHGGA